jgi:hypothetical protein
MGNGNDELLLPIDDHWQMLEEALAAFEPGFELIRDQPIPSTYSTSTGSVPFPPTEPTPKASAISSAQPDASRGRDAARHHRWAAR